MSDRTEEPGTKTHKEESLALTGNTNSVESQPEAANLVKIRDQLVRQREERKAHFDKA